MEQSFYWDEGSPDKLTVSYSGETGSSQMTVTSDPNRSLAQRQMVIEFKDADGVKLGELTITQKARQRSYAVSYNAEYR